MFQYAFAYAFAKTHASEFKLDISGFDSYELRHYALDSFCIIEEIATNNETNSLKYKCENIWIKFIRKLIRQQTPFANSYYTEYGFQFDKNVCSKQGNVYFEGYWQSENYFLNYREGLLKLFKLKYPPHERSSYFQQRILATEAVGLHVRRGDYITNVRTNSILGTCDLDYYRQAVSLFESKLLKPHFFIFSDDLVWAKENLNFINNISFVELGEEILDHEEMWLMSQCQHNIIANSSFGWWGAWLNQNPDKIVIAPQRWFRDTSINTRDLLPDSWIRL